MSQALGRVLRRLAIGALALSALSGCATLRSAFPRAEVTTQDSRQLLLQRVPFYPQTEFQCGPAALAGVLGASGVKKTPKALTPEIYLPARRGSLQVELLAATRRAGRIAYPVERTIDALIAEVSAGRPVLILQNLLVRTVPRWHYAVVVGADPKSNRLILNTGTHKAQAVRASTFLRTWDWAGRWGMVALRPGEMPARADPATFVAAVADFEAVAGATKARPAYAAAEKRWPRDPSVQLALGNQAHDAGQRIKAARHYRVGLDYAPGDAVLVNNLASVLGELGCPDEGRAVLDSLSPQRDDRWHDQLAQTRRELNGVSRAPSAQCGRLIAGRTRD